MKFKNSNKVAVTWETKSGKRKRTRFHKGTSRGILADKKALHGGEYITKKAWTERYGRVTDPVIKPLAPRDIRFYHMTEKEAGEIRARGYSAGSIRT